MDLRHLSCPFLTLSDCQDRPWTLIFFGKDITGNTNYISTYLVRQKKFLQESGKDPAWKRCRFGSTTTTTPTCTSHKPTNFRDRYEATTAPASLPESDEKDRNTESSINLPLRQRRPNHDGLVHRNPSRRKHQHQRCEHCTTSSKHRWAISLGT